MAAVVKEMFRLASQGVGSKNIIQQLNQRVLSRSWVIMTLKNRAVLGEYKPKGREVIQGYYPQIISQSEFDAARTQMRRQFMRENAKHEAVLAILTEEIDALQKKMSRIELAFMPDRLGVAAFLQDKLSDAQFHRHP